jgi:hypothetical protein
MVLILSLGRPGGFLGASNGVFLKVGNAFLLLARLKRLGGPLAQVNRASALNLSLAARTRCRCRESRLTSARRSF